jgi:signal transduction histidine kinase
MTSALANTELRGYRTLLGLGAAVYLGWWFAVEALLPGSFNPLPGRLLIVAALALGLVATYVNAAARAHARLVFTLCVWLLTAHYFFLLDGNHGEESWCVGTFITVGAASAAFSTRQALVVYSLFVMALATVVAVRLGPLGLRTLLLPGLATVLLLANLAAHGRARLEEERLRVVRAQEQRDVAVQANEFKTTLLGLVGHELTTPLQTIQLNVEALDRRVDAPATERVDRQHRMLRASRQLGDLIETLLVYARIDAGRLVVEEEAFDLAAVAAEAVDDLESLARAKRLELGIGVGSEVEGIEVRSDPKLVRLILTNLIANAIKYTDAGTITVDVATDSAGARVSVRDTGRGIPEKDQQRIFDAFTQVEPMHHHHLPGVGLGLALVKEMSDALGAQIAVLSKVGEGSTFTFSLPRRAQGKIA